MEDQIMKRKRKYETPKVEVLEVRLSDCIATISPAVSPKPNTEVGGQSEQVEVINKGSESWDDLF